MSGAADPTRPAKGSAGIGVRARGFLSNLGRVRRRVGWAGTVELVLARAAPRLLAYERTSLLEAPSVGTLYPELDARMVTSPEPAVDRLYERMAESGEPEVPGFSRSTLRRRFAAGHELWLFHHDGEPVHTRWIVRDRFRFGGRSVPVPSGYCVTEAIATLPEFRGRGIHVQADQHLRAVVGRNGSKGLLSAINGFNRRLLEMKLSPANGTRRIATAHRLAIAGRRWLRVAPEPGRRNALSAEDLGLTVGRWVSERSPEPDAWDRAVRRTVGRPYLDPLMARVKRDAHLRLLEHWLGNLERASILKTDLWEEGVAGDELLFTLARRAGRAAGVDISAEACTRAREAAAHAGVAVDITPADLGSLPFDDASMDAVVSTSTLDHLPAEARPAALTELRRVLAFDGVLVVTCDNADNIGDPLLGLCSRLGLVPFPLEAPVSLAELEALLSRAGFVPAEHEFLVGGPRVMTTVAVRAARILGGRRGDRAVAALLTALEAARRRWPRRAAAFVAVRAVAATPSAGR